MELSEEARKVWKSKCSANLMGAMLGQEPMSAEGQEALDELKAMNAATRSKGVGSGSSVPASTCDAVAVRGAAAREQPGAKS